MAAQRKHRQELLEHYNLPTLRKHTGEKNGTNVAFRRGSPEKNVVWTMHEPALMVTDGRRWCQEEEERPTT